MSRKSITGRGSSTSGRTQAFRRALAIFHGEATPSVLPGVERREQSAVFIRINGIASVQKYENVVRFRFVYA